MCWRQWGSRYAIRAGRNLPDKEFRYLRTVIVTAAVYRGFDSRLAPLLLTFRHRAGVSPYTSSSEFVQHSSLKRLGILYQSTCVGFGYGLCGGYFLELLRCLQESNNRRQHT